MLHEHGNSVPSLCQGKHIPMQNNMYFYHNSTHLVALFANYEVKLQCSCMVYIKMEMMIQQKCNIIYQGAYDLHCGG